MKIQSTYEQIIANPKRKARIERGYKKLLLNELKCAKKQKNILAVQKLTEEIKSL